MDGSAYDLLQSRKGSRGPTHTPRPSQWKSARTTNAIERLHEEFKRRIKTQTMLPSVETAAAVLGTARFRSDHAAEGRRGRRTLDRQLSAN